MMRSNDRIPSPSRQPMTHAVNLNYEEGQAVGRILRREILKAELNLFLGRRDANLWLATLYKDVQEGYRMELSRQGLVPVIERLLRFKR
jgi:hypothetical protein